MWKEYKKVLKLIAENKNDSKRLCKWHRKSIHEKKFR